MRILNKCTLDAVFPFFFCKTKQKPKMNNAYRWLVIYQCASSTTLCVINCFLQNILVFQRQNNSNQSSQDPYNRNEYNSQGSQKI